MAQKYITGSCTISKNVVEKDGFQIFENLNTNITDFFLSVYNYFKMSYPKFYKMDNLSKLGWLAAEILLMHNDDKSRYNPEETGIILANANSSLDNDIKYFDSLNNIASPSLFVYTLPNIMIGEICIRNQIKGEHALFIQPVFDGEFIEKQVSYLMDMNLLEACLCGWVDVLGEDYKATLFWIEKEKKNDAMIFSTDNISRVFETIM